MPAPSPQTHPLERYRCLVDDWPAFTAALARPLPKVVWSNPLKSRPQQLLALLQAEGLNPVPLGWSEGGFRLPPGCDVGSRWWYLAGLAHSQEEASLVPALLLDPRPGERVLDLCAAPGGKTARLALAVGEAGTVVANDVSAGRTKSLRATLERLGLTNVSTTIHDGANYPPQAGLFDRVLVDAPCSGEGTARKYSAGLPDTTARRDWTGVQKALLRKALQLCRSGGRVVYSTCTFAPEENEAVVDAVLAELGPEIVTLREPAPLGLAAHPGVQAWQGRRFRSDLACTQRLWPHHNDSGGFFVAVLDKHGRDGRGNSQPAAPPPRAVDTAQWAEPLARRFGFSHELWRGYTVFRQSRRGLHLVNHQHRPPPQPSPNAQGLFFFGTDTAYPKLTTAATMRFGNRARSNVVDTDAEQLSRYLNRDSFQITGDQAHTCTGPGFVIVRHQGWALGIGLLRGPSGRVESLFPKHWNGRRPPAGS